MAYGKRYSKYGRKARRGTRTLSTRNVFNNKGARAQAKQISALTKRVRAVYKQCKPEVKVVNPADLNNRGFGADTDIPGIEQALVYKFPVPVSGTNDENRIGDIIRLLPAEVFLTMSYEEIYETLQTKFSTTIIPIKSSAIQARVLFVQSKIPGQDLDITTIGDVLETNFYNPVGAADEIEAQLSMKMPLKTGVTTYWNILSDKVITVSKDSGQKSFRFKIKPVYKSMRWYDDSNYSTNPAGTIFMIVLTSGWAVNKYTVLGVDPMYDYNKLNFSWRVRQPFTDA